VKDLACLVAQQRDMENIDHAKKAVLDPSNEPVKTYEEVQEKQEIKRDKVLLSRQVMFNIVALLFEDYTHEDMRFVNFNYPL
jgi:hypothetical protein